MNITFELRDKLWFATTTGYTTVGVGNTPYDAGKTLKQAIIGEHYDTRRTNEQDSPNTRIN